MHGKFDEALSRVPAFQGLKKCQRTCHVLMLSHHGASQDVNLGWVQKNQHIKCLISMINFQNF